MAELTFPALTPPSPPAGSEPCLSARPEGPARPAASLLQNKSPKARGNSSGGPEELEVLPEEEAAGGDEDREKEIDLLVQSGWTGLCACRPVVSSPHPITPLL